MNIDGDDVTRASLLIAVLTPFVKPIRIAFLRWQNGLSPGQVDESIAQRPYILRSRIILDILNGASLVPFLLLVGSAVSPSLLKLALGTNRVFMGVAGLIGTIFVVGEIMTLSRDT
jgi:hypothetical protein